MGRPRRIQFPGACYFITLQGNNRADIFVSSQDRREFLALLRSSQERFQLKVYAYCLLSHQAILLIETSQGNLATFMQAFATSYTKHFNSSHSTAGHLFQGRYKALVVDKETLLAEMTRYVHLAPVRAGLRESPWRYQWSSCSDYVQILRRESLVDVEGVLSSFGKNRLTASVRYLKFLKERMRSASDMILPIVRGAAIGHASFLDRIESRQGGPGGSGEGAARLTAMAQAKKIISEVALSHGLEEDRLLGPVRWRDVAQARRQAMHRVWKEARLSVTEIARLFSRTPSAVSQAIRFMETRPS
ncbi:MAG TPA: hypothetical protein DEB40_02075 [Elusimicrobia bacterium]|nr:hypothetical protein [Elusimicrobiota bacterium]HBT60518.1 hypothetical protein [Elusimicrobiota bacterium]